MTHRPAPLKKIEPTAIEDFNARHWTLLIVLEQQLVDRKKIEHLSADTRVFSDLLAQDFVTIGTPPATLSDRGWEIAGALRRWKASSKNLDAFVAIACGACSRIRYGERGTACMCGGSKE